MSQRPRIALIDGHALLYRAFHAIPFLSKRDGELINAVFGFTATVLSVLKELKPEYIAVSFDLAEPTFRHKEYADYKATREKAPDELRSQFGRVREVVEVLGMPIFELAGYEADDVIGSLARKYAVDNGLEAVIVTGDKDSLQLLSDAVRVFTLRKGIKDTVIYDPKMLLDEIGLTPDEFIEFKALKGDTSDNIPGVPGIGDKTAQILVAKYKTLEGLYAALEKDPADHSDIKPKVRANLGEFKEQAYLSRDLSRIVTDLELPFELEKCTVQDFDLAAAEAYFKEMEFTSLLPRLKQVVDSEAGSGVAVATPTPAVSPSAERDWSKKDYKLVGSQSELDELLKKLSKQELVAVDTETAQLDSIAQNLIGMSFSWERNTGYYVPVGHASGPNLDLEQTLQKLKPWYENAAIGKIGHNLKYDVSVLAAYDITVDKLVFDTMLASYLINPGARTLKLDTLAYQELSYEMQPITELIGKGKDEKSMADLSSEEVAPYAAEDTDLTWQLYEKFEPQLREIGVDKVHAEIELPLITALATMERHGVKLDTKFLARMSDDFAKKLDTMIAEIHQLAGHEFNINSPSQLSVVLYDELEVGKGITRRGAKHKTTAASELEKMKDHHPIIPLLLEYRELTKLKGTYLDALPKLVRDDTGRIHTSYSQTTAATGRLASNDPNLQNIPIRTELGRQIRRAFVTEPGWQLVSADYSQFELRIAAHISGDEHLSQAFREGQDIHAATAAKVSGVDIADVTPEQRYAAKAVNFSILYGATSYGLSAGTGMSNQEATEYIEQYFKTYPKLKEYMDAMIAKATTDGYVETLFGRRRYLPEIMASQFNVRESAKRMAINMPIQGTQADILKIAMCNIHRGLSNRAPDARMLLTVHDELVFEAPQEQVKATTDYIVEAMQNAYALDVPVVAEAKVGDNWGQMQPV